MSQNLMDDLGAELLMWYLGDFHAKTSALPETVPDWTAKGQAMVRNGSDYWGDTTPIRIH